ncbi:hypothetical protein BT96DRAFT_950206 [Gymnopus androsaceus JB14]|uniref:Uncharacterized protein n=1 Tax=Gymnopus androsaceus JB14 TaxID=1447944 RepID=A0A6A4GH38_9AGAR|nr:hypothetical protein BT96DRAFT_950206 [Gymnopus androsaceus JB14]
MASLANINTQLGTINTFLTDISGIQLQPMHVHNNMAADHSGFLVDGNLVALPAPFDTQDHFITLTTIAHLDAFAANSAIQNYPNGAPLAVKHQVVGMYLGSLVLECWYKEEDDEEREAVEVSATSQGRIGPLSVTQCPDQRQPWSFTCFLFSPVDAASSPVLVVHGSLIRSIIINKRHPTCFFHNDRHDDPSNLAARLSSCLQNPGSVLVSVE